MRTLVKTRVMGATQNLLDSSVRRGELLANSDACFVSSSNNRLGLTGSKSVLQIATRILTATMKNMLREAFIVHDSSFAGHPFCSLSSMAKIRSHCMADAVRLSTTPQNSVSASWVQKAAIYSPLGLLTARSLTCAGHLRSEQTHS